MPIRYTSGEQRKIARRLWALKKKAQETEGERGKEMRSEVARLQSELKRSVEIYGSWVVNRKKHVHQKMDFANYY